MTNEELQETLSLLKSKLREAHKKNDKKLISRYVSDLNKLWEKASVEMLKNAEKDGVYKPTKS
tara:strand:- start:292 stop:480 length:189 start_codon:yes stop_codon:yes gene_type:complete